jgi:cysteinyl-tRNA synthetase
MSLETALILILAAAAIALAAGYVLGRRRHAAPEAPTATAAPPPAPRAAPPPARPTAAPPPASAGGGTPPGAGTSRSAPAPAAAPLPAPLPTAAPPPAPAGGSSPAPKSNPPRTRSAAAGPPLLARVTSWGYQLQDLDIARAAASPFDLLVIDYARDGSDETRLTSSELARLKRKPDGSRRIVLAYLSIGEAESYRYYWDARWSRQKPAWVLGENPEWQENYAVCFWEEAWQQLMCGSPDAYLDRILAQGFDGVYLDKCDVFEDLAARFRKVAAGRPTMAQDMVAFVSSLSGYAKGKVPGFLVVMQNAEPLIAHRALRAAIDGVAKEELLYGLDGPERKNAAADVADSRRMLDLAKAEGKAILAVEYLDNRAKIADAARRMAELGYVLYVAAKDRALDRLVYEVHEA